MHASCICTIALTLFVYWAINIFSPFHQMYSQVKTIIVPFLGVPYKKKTRGRRGRESLGKIRGMEHFECLVSLSLFLGLLKLP